MSNHPFSTLPAMPLGPSGRADETTCEFCGEPALDSENCGCWWADIEIDDAREREGD